MFSQRRGLLHLQHCDKVLHEHVTWGMQHASLDQPHYLPLADRKARAEIRQAARSLYGDRASSGISSAASGAMNAVGAVWSFVSAEAATEGSLAPEDAAPLPPAPKMDISVAVSVLSEGQSPFQRPLQSLIVLNIVILKAWLWLVCVGCAFGMQIVQGAFFHVSTSFAGASLVLYRAQDVASEHLARHADGVSSPTAMPAWLQTLAQGSPPMVRSVRSNAMMVCLER